MKKNPSTGTGLGRALDGSASGAQRTAGRPKWLDLTNVEETVGAKGWALATQKGPYKPS